MDPIVDAAARNLAAWHATSLAALGVGSDRQGGWWLAPQVAPSIYHSAIGLDRPAGRAERRRMVADLQAWADETSTFLSVCDSFGVLDLRPLGLEHRARTPWFERPPARTHPLPHDPVPEGLTVERVDTIADLVTFERTMVRAYRARPPVADLDIHAPGVLADHDLVVLLARLDGAPAGVAMAHRAAGVVGVYGVGVVPEARGLGIATALTRRAVASADDLPVVLQPSPIAEALYRRLGFTGCGWYDHWA
ncbi:MAG: GNAT family N-acetyltransferase [Acidimicrobiales bacterium]